MTPWIDLFIVALLPLTALSVVMQKRPYFALVSRGIMGVVAVLLYAVMGAPDVALTEALVGTLLTVILYAITVRSTQVMRVGRRAGDAALQTENPLRQFCSRHRLTLRMLTFPDDKALAAALKAGRVDAVYAPSAMLVPYYPDLQREWPSDQAVTVLAAHGRWHERRMREQFGDQARITRLVSSTAGGSH